MLELCPSYENDGPCIDWSKLNNLLRTLLVLFLEFANDKERTSDTHDLETKPKFKFRRDFLGK